MDIQQNNVAVLHFNLVNQDGSTIFIRKTKLATFNLINPSAVSVPITDIGFDVTLNQCWIRVPKESNATTGQYYGVLNIVDDDWGTYTTSKIKVYSVVSDADEDTKSIVFTATCLATQVTNPSGGNSPYYNATTGTWWQYSDTLKAFEDTGVGNLIKYITKNVQHLKDGTGNGSIVTCLDDEISANNMATGLCSTDFGKNNENRGESCVALGENNYIPEGVSNATAIAGAQPSAVDVFAVGDKTKGHKNVFEINKFGDISFRPDSSQERTTILQDILDSVIKNVVYDSSKYSLTVTFYSAADNANKIKTYDLSGLKAVLKDDAVKEISVNQATAVMTVNTINGSSQQIQLPTSGDATTTTHGLMTATDKVKLDGISSIIEPFNFLECSEFGSITIDDTQEKSHAILVITNSRVIAKKIKIFISNNAGQKIRCAIYKVNPSGSAFTLDLIVQTQLYEESGTTGFVDIPFETITTLDSDTVYYIAIGCSGVQTKFLGKTIKLMDKHTYAMLYSDDIAFETFSFSNSYPQRVEIANQFIPYFKIL